MCTIDSPVSKYRSSNVHTDLQTSIYFEDNLLVQTRNVRRKSTSQHRCLKDWSSNIIATGPVQRKDVIRGRSLTIFNFGRVGQSILWDENKDPHCRWLRWANAQLVYKNQFQRFSARMRGVCSSVTELKHFCVYFNLGKSRWSIQLGHTLSRRSKSFIRKFFEKLSGGTVSFLFKRLAVRTALRSLQHRFEINYLVGSELSMYFSTINY